MVVATDPGGAFKGKPRSVTGSFDGSPDSYERYVRRLVAMAERHVVGPRSVRGTTHVSVVDPDGNVAAMTTSNGSC